MRFLSARAEILFQLADHARPVGPALQGQSYAAFKRSIRKAAAKNRRRRKASERAWQDALDYQDYKAREWASGLS